MSLWLARARRLLERQGSCDLCMRPDAARSSARGRVGVERDDALSRADYALAQARRLQHLDPCAEAERELARVLFELEAHQDPHPTFPVRLAQLLDAREPARVVQARDGSARLQNDSARLQNHSARLQNGSARLQNGSAASQNRSAPGAPVACSAPD